jgi:homocysteine S-methyltransferase
MLALTDTWRANQERIARSRFSGRRINHDNARFLIGLRESYGPAASPICIGGLTGPRGDAYKPEEAPSAQEAEAFHAPQLEALAGAGVDFLMAATLPAFPEARGIAAAMARTGLPCLLSFVIRRDGALLDGTPLTQAIEALDGGAAPPSGYAVNCVHPSVFHEGLDELERRCPGLSRRIVMFQANTSARDPRELDGASELETEEPEALADSMWRARSRFHTPILGGCCGTDASHIECLARRAVV